MNIYKIRNTKNTKLRNLLHIDIYRLRNESELVEIGVEDYLGNEDTVCVVEWPEKMKGLLENKKTIDISIEHKGEKERVIDIGY